MSSDIDAFDTDRDERPVAQAAAVSVGQSLRSWFPFPSDHVLTLLNGRRKRGQEPSSLGMALVKKIMDDLGLRQLGVGQRFITRRIGTPSEQGFVSGGTSRSSTLCDACRANNRTPCEDSGTCHSTVCSFRFVSFVVPTARRVATPSAEPPGMPLVHRRKQAGQKNSDKYL
jgi:hypothetical protein